MLRINIKDLFFLVKSWWLRALVAQISNDFFLPQRLKGTKNHDVRNIS
jgi:hypothetical protein